MLRHLVACLALLLTAQLTHAQESRMNSAVDQGRALSREQAGKAGAGVKAAPGPAAAVPHYNQTGDGLYQAGKGNPAPAGTQKILDCATATPQQLAGFAGKHCDATNFLTRNATTRPAISVGKNDPLIQGAQVRADQGRQMGLPSGLGSTSPEAPQCETVTNPGQTTYDTRVCHEEGAATEEKCSVGRVIEVNGEYRYECETQVKKLKEISCDITLGEACTTAPATEVCPDGSKPADGMCSSVTYEESSADVAYSCPEGHVRTGRTCVITETSPASISSYACPSGYTGSGSTCTKTTVETLAGTPVYSCPVGATLSGSECLSVQMQAAGISSYTCPPGSTLSGSSCMATEIIPPLVNNTCPAGYTLSGGSCARTTSSSATPVYSCSAGYTLSGSNCNREVRSTANVASYTCPSGFTASGSTCTKTTTQTEVGTPVYACPSDYSLSSSTCSKTTTTLAMPNYGCVPGYVLSGPDCLRTVTTPATTSQKCPPEGCGWDGAGSQDRMMSWCNNMAQQGYQVILVDFYQPLCVVQPKTIYNCPAGTTLTGSNCVQTTSQAASITSYSCPAGSTLSGSNCNTTQTQAASISSYACPSGYTGSGSTCTKTTDETLAGTPVYSCPAGATLSGSDCLSVQTQAAGISSYTCPPGSTLSGSSCMATEIIPPLVNNTCPAGYTLSGGSCARTTSSSATPVYSCSAGYTLSGSSCTREVRSTASVASYTCPSGFTASGSSCTKTTTQTEAGTPVYACPSDYTLSGSSCSKASTSTATPVYSCRPGGTLAGDMCTYVVTVTSESVKQFACSEADGILTPGVVQGGNQTFVCCKESITNQCGGLEALLK